MKKKLLFTLLFFCSFSFSLFAQSPQTWTSADMYLAIKKLNVLGSVLYVAAHPDDENTRLITYFSKDKLYRTAYLSITRGDGGQNLIGDEQGIELGLIRTQELLAARRIDGGEQFFTRAFDFGYSKSPEETFDKWDKEKILSDVVWVVRKFQPDIIITRFPTTGEGGHGHHTASAILANEAFTAASDPNRFPEQLKFVKTWQAKRILWNGFNFGGVNTTSSDQFKFDVGGYSPLLGKSYGEIASASRSQHKSQGFGATATRGEALEYFRTTGGTAPDNDIMDGIDLSWKKVKGADAIERMVNDIAEKFDFLHPENSVKDLVKLYSTINQLADSYWKEKKLNETKTLIEQCSGLWMDAFTQEQYAVQTDSIRFSFQFNNRLGVNTTLKNVSVDGFDSVMNLNLPKNRNINFAKTIFVPANKPVTQPYWLEHPMQEGYFNVTDQQKIGQADVDPSYVISISLNIEGVDLNFIKPARNKFTDPVRGELYHPLVVTPAITFKDFDPIYVKSEKNNSLEISFSANKQVNIPAASTNSSNSSDTDSKLFGGFSLQKKQFHTGILKDAELEEKVYKINVSPDHSRGGYISRRIEYDHIPAINYFKEALLTVRKIDVKTYGKKIAYIVGAGDKVPEALEQMGFEVNRLTEKEISKNPLDKFDAIVVGVRAYNTIDWLPNHYEKLMKYVEQGGNLVVQYNTSNFISSVKSKIGPYSFDITRTRITDENSPITFLKPDHPVFNFPNKIIQDDFKGWIQERSIYHAGNWDKNFESVLAMNDPGEKPEEGSLIIAKYGKGVFVYTGLVFFRELPAGVPGAYRLLANIIALNRKKAF